MPSSSNDPGNENIHILVDADSCPVKQEVYKVALRHQVQVKIVSNCYIKIPEYRIVTLIVVSSDFDAADDFIAEHAGSNSIVITSDILLAQRSLKTRATVLAPNGKPFTENSIGAAVAQRALMEDLRAGGEQTGGPPPFSKNDRSRFLASLHEALVKLKKGS
jgi:uncharacterized protein YaiI (UPF0178 family)